MKKHDEIMKKGGFRIVKKKRRNFGNKRISNQVRVVNSFESHYKTESFKKGEFLSSVSRYRKLSREVINLKRLRKSLLENLHMEFVVCYGIGDILKSEAAVAQFSLLLELLNGDKDSGLRDIPILMYDPAIPRNCSTLVFKEVRKFLENRFGCSWIDKNENCCRMMKNPCLFYIPHGDLWMYRNVISSNANNIEAIRIMGNDFTGYEEKDRKFSNVLSKSKHKQIFVKVRKDVEYQLGLNDFCVHSFG